MKKNRIRRWFNFFKPRKEKTNTSITPAPTPIIENSDLPLNKFGQPEHLGDQCENRTCKCGPTNCEIDDLMCYESMLLMTYHEKRKKAQREKEQ